MTRRRAVGVEQGIEQGDKLRPVRVQCASSARPVQYTYSKPVFGGRVVYGRGRVPEFR
jgi:hypothetical protein